MSRQIKIIQDELQPPMSPKPTEQMIIDVPPPPPIQLSEPITQPIKIKFSSGEEIFIKREWYDNYLSLKQPIIFHEYINFQHWIFPLLNKQSLRFTKEIDESKELGAFIEEVNNYGMMDLLTENIIQDIADNSGLTKILIEIKNYLIKCYSDKITCFNKKKIQRVMAEIEDFKKEWTSYTELLSVKYKEEKFKNLSADFIINNLRGSETLSLCALNMFYHNLIFEFCEWAKLYLIEKNKDKFNAFRLSLSVSLFENLESISDIANNISSLLRNTSDSKINKDIILQKIGDVTNMKNLLAKK